MGATVAAPTVDLRTLVLHVDSVAPFTSVPQVAPVILDVPQDVAITFRATTRGYQSRFSWMGASVKDQDGYTSIATQQFRKPGAFSVTVTSTSTDPLSPGLSESQSITIRVGTTRAAEVKIQMSAPLPGSMEIGNNHKVWPCSAVISHAAYSHLIQWAAEGGTASYGFGPSFSPIFSAVGRHELRVGPDPTQRAQIDIYEVTRVLVHSSLGDAVDYGTPVTFTAITNPLGRESYVRWHVNTMNGMHSHALPEDGAGGVFITEFMPSGDAGLFWGQVYADFTPAFSNPDLPNSTTPFDPFTMVSCPASPGQLPLRVEKERMGEGGAGCGSGCSGGVQLAPGQFVLSASDLDIPGRGIPFRFQRTYRSQYACNGPLGYGWDFTYNMRLVARLDAMGAPTGDLYLLDGSGRSDLFVRTPLGTYTTPPGHYRDLSRNSDLTFRLLERDGTIFYFSPIIPQANYRAFLSGIVDRNGNALTFLYDLRGRLAVVKDALGRNVIFAYNAIGRLEHITDFHGRTVVFGYDANGDLVSVRSPLVPAGSTPNGNDFPLGKTTSYTYASGFPSGSLNHNLLTVTRPVEFASSGPPMLVNTYGTDPNNSQEFDKVLQQALGGTNAAASARGIGPAGGNLTYFYATLNPGADPNNLTIPRTRATIVDRAGNVSVMEQNSVGGDITRRRYTGRVDPNLPRSSLQSLIPSNNLGFPPISRLRSSDPASFLTSFLYNRDGEVTLVTYPATNTVSSAYDTGNPDRRQQGNLLQMLRTPDPARGGDQSVIQRSWQYDAAHSFVTVETDGRGHSTFYGRDAAGNLLHIQSPVTSVVEDWEYNAFGQVTAHILPDNGSGWRRRDVFTYYGSGLQQGYLQRQVMDALGRALTTTIEHDPVGNVTRLVDAQGHDTLFTMNTLNQVVRETSREVTTGSGIRYIKDFSFNANDQMARLDVQNVDDAGVLQPNAFITTSYEYDILDHAIAVVEEVDPNHFVTTEYRYDPEERVTLARGGESTAGRQPADTVSTLYDERRLPYREIMAASDPSQSSDQFDYDLNGNLVTTREGLESSPHVSTQIYDGFDRPVVFVDPMGNTQTRHYDGNGNVVSERTDGELIDVPGGSGNVRLAETTLFYDDMDRLIRSDDAFFTPQTQAPIGDGVSTNLTDYTATSELKAVTDDNGHQTLYTYDSTGELSLVADAAGNTTSFAYDQNLNLSQVQELDVNGLGGPNEVFTTTHAYDNLNRLTRLTDPAGNTFDSTFDSRGNEIRSIDSMRASPSLPGNTVLHEYDGLNRETRSTVVLTSDGTGAGTVVGSIVTQMVWDDSSRLTAQTDSNNHTTTYQYDPLGRVTQTSNADGTAESTVYDVHGNAIQVTQPNGTVVTSGFDDLDGMTTRTISPGSGVSSDTTSESYQYDGLSRAKVAQNNLSTVTRTYDSLANVTSESINGVTTFYGHDGEGNRTSINYPGGRLVTTTFDPLDRPSVISDGAGPRASYLYLGPGRAAGRSYANGTTTTFTYDGRDGVPNAPGDFGTKTPVRIRHERTSPLTTLDDRTFAWDRAGNRLEQTDIRPGSPGITTRYTYDSAYRMRRAQDLNASMMVLRDSGYALDGVGNRTSVSGPGGGTYTQDSTTPAPADAQVNQYTTTPFDTRQYDANGHLKSVTAGGGTSTYSYDYAGRLVQETNPLTGVTVHYVYDALHRPIERSVTAGGPAQVTRFYYDEWRQIEEQNGSGATQATYLYGNNIDEVLSMKRAGVDYYFHADDQDTVRAVSDASGNVVERYEYGDFGAPTFLNASGSVIPSSAIGNPFLFSGRRYESETGLFDYRMRYFDPKVGRFVTRDPIGGWGDESAYGNQFTYAANNPWTHIDPTGESLEPSWVKDPNGVDTCSDTQKSVMRDAVPRGSALARRASNHLASLKTIVSRSCDSGYMTWFSFYGPYGFDVVRRRFQNVAAEFENRSLSFDCGPDATCDYARAFTDLGVPGADIHLCPTMFRSDLGLGYMAVFPALLNIPAATQRGSVVLHELTHQYGTNAGDYRHEYYDPFMCLGIARVRPDKAIRNATSYQYYSLTPLALSGGCSLIDRWARRVTTVARKTVGKVVKSAKRAGERVAGTVEKAAGAVERAAGAVQQAAKKITKALRRHH